MRARAQTHTHTRARAHTQTHTHTHIHTVNLSHIVSQNLKFVKENLMLHEFFNCYENSSGNIIFEWKYKFVNVFALRILLPNTYIKLKFFHKFRRYNTWKIEGRMDVTSVSQLLLKLKVSNGKWKGTSSYLYNLYTNEYNAS